MDTTPSRPNSDHGTTTDAPQAAREEGDGSADPRWQLSRRDALSLFASTVVAGTASWAGTEAAAADGPEDAQLAAGDVIAFAGAHTTTRLTVSVIALAKARRARVQLRLASTGALVRVSPEVRLTGRSLSLHEFTGLTPDTRYKYVPELQLKDGSWVAYTDEGPDGHVGWCQTMPTAGTAHRRKVVLMACQRSAGWDGHPTVQTYSYDKIWADRANITDLVHLGDLHYSHIKSMVTQPFVKAYIKQLTYHHHLRRALRVAGLIYTPSDHEAGPNNGEPGFAFWTLAARSAIKQVFPMHDYLVPDVAEQHKDLSRAIPVGRMLWVVPDFRNYFRQHSEHNFEYETSHPGHPLNKYRAFGEEVTEALARKMDRWRDDGGIVVYWSDPVPYSLIDEHGQETQLRDKTDAYATYPATRAYLFPHIDEGIFGDYHNICDDDGTNNRHGESGWFGCAGQWASPVFRGGDYQYRHLVDLGDDEVSLYATIEYVDDGTRITSTKTGYQTHPVDIVAHQRVTVFEPGRV